MTDLTANGSRFVLRTASEVNTLYPIPEPVRARIVACRREIAKVVDGRDPRVAVIVGPCSIEDPDSALEYARRLARVDSQVAETLIVVMRVYLEKPRSEIGWPGLICDPYLDGSYRLDEGLLIARRLLLSIAGMGLRIATETLDPALLPYIAPFVSWFALGARSIESSFHRRQASGLGAPVGVKNATNGDIATAICAIKCAGASHVVSSCSDDGRPIGVVTAGNPLAHLVLRGGHRPNYDPASVSHAAMALARHALAQTLFVDASHGNSSKQAERQVGVIESCIDQIRAGAPIRGLMIESHLEAGKQPMPKDRGSLRPGLSVTDACLGWQETETLLLRAHERLLPVVRAGHALMS